MFKEFLKTKGISEADFALKTPQEMAELHNEYSNKQIEDLKAVVAKSGTKEEIDAANKSIETFKLENAEAIKGFAKSADVDATNKKVDDLQSDMTSLIETMKVNNGQKEVSFSQAIKNVLTEEKFNEIKSHVQSKSKGGWLELEVLKVAGTVTTANASDTSAPANYAASIATSYSPYTYGDQFVEQYLTTGATDLANVAYVNESAGEGDAAIVAEGGLKPLIDADFNTKFSAAKKVAGRMKASEESISDYKWLMSAIEGKLKGSHDRARQADVLSSVIASASAFNASLLTGFTKLPIGTSSLYDAIAAVVATVAVESEGVFIPNVAFVNTIDALQMKLTKDANNNYVLPPFMDASGRMIEGVMVIAKPQITAGTYVIGDLKNINLLNVWGYTVRIGWENDDFSKNLVTMLGESRYHVYITDNDKRGIVQGTFAAVKTAIESAT